MKSKNIFLRIPDTLTLMNLILGFGSILYSIEADYNKAALLILLAMMADAGDGFFARVLKKESRLGMELDSLADMVSFGIAPAILIYQHYLGFNEAIAVVLIPICSAIRLARFNILEDKTTFTGLPTPAVGGFFASLIFTGKTLTTYHIVFSATVLSYLMISEIKYPAYKKIHFKKPPKTLILLFISALPVLFGREYFIVPILTYIILGFVLDLGRRLR